MSPVISVIVPTMGRAYRLAQVVENIAQATTTPHEILMVAEPGDQETRDAVPVAPGVFLVLNARKANYAGAVNTAYGVAEGRYLFTGSDDLNFRPGWDTAVLEVMSDQVLVGGTNDMIHPWVAEGRHATHYLIDRRYIEDTGGTWDKGPGTILNEDYGHGFTDSEFISVAKARGVFAPCMAAVVEHLHHITGRSADDATYAANRARQEGDEALFRSRWPMWDDVRAE